MLLNECGVEHWHTTLAVDLHPQKTISHSYSSSVSRWLHSSFIGRITEVMDIGWLHTGRVEIECTGELLPLLLSSFPVHHSHLPTPNLKYPPTAFPVLFPTRSDSLKFQAISHKCFLLSLLSKPS